MRRYFPTAGITRPWTPSPKWVSCIAFYPKLQSKFKPLVKESKVNGSVTSSSKATKLLQDLLNDSFCCHKRFSQFKACMRVLQTTRRTGGVIVSAGNWEPVSKYKATHCPLQTLPNLFVLTAVPPTAGLKDTCPDKGKPLNTRPNRRSNRQYVP